MPADGSCNLSVIALDVSENKAFASVVRTFAVWSQPSDVGFQELLNVEVSREETLVVQVVE